MICMYRGSDMREMKRLDGPGLSVIYQRHAGTRRGWRRRQRRRQTESRMSELPVMMGERDAEENVMTMAGRENRYSMRG